MELNKDKASRLESLLTDNERESSQGKTFSPPKPANSEEDITVKKAFTTILNLQCYPIFTMLISFGY